jgi:hypothetical protein
MPDLIIVSQAFDSSEDNSTLLDGSNQANIRTCETVKNEFFLIPAVYFEFVKVLMIVSPEPPDPNHSVLHGFNSLGSLEPSKHPNLFNGME